LTGIHIVREACLRQLNTSLTAADLLKMVCAPFEGELWVAVLRLQFESGPVRLFTPDIGISTSPDERSRDKWRVFRSCTDFEKPQGRAAALAAARLRRAQRLGSVNRNAFSRDIAGYLEEEVAGRVIEIQGEGTAVRIAALTHGDRFTEVDGSQEVSVRVIAPHAVSELESPVRSMLPHPRQTLPVLGSTLGL